MLRVLFIHVHTYVYVMSKEPSESSPDDSSSSLVAAADRVPAQWRWAGGERGREHSQRRLPPHQSSVLAYVRARSHVGTARPLLCRTKRTRRLAQFSWYSVREILSPLRKCYGLVALSLVVIELHTSGCSVAQHAAGRLPLGGSTLCSRVHKVQG